MFSTNVNFTSFLLDDNFGITDADAARVIGNLGTAGDITSVSTELVLGTLMDLIGRKIPSVGGLILAGTGFLLTPIPKKLGGVYCFRCMIDVGALPLMWSPFGVDYIQSESLGLYSAYSTMITQFTSILGSTVAI